jgi:hypothetical protein
MNQAVSAVAVSSPRGDDLLKQTVRLTAILVGACVLFVGTLSLIAVLVTSKAVSGAGTAEASKTEAPTKKPLSI